MTLNKLDVFNVRIIESATLNPASQLNFIYGNNASGKSSLLEAIYILGLAKSFRTSSLSQVVSANTDSLTVSGRLHHNHREMNLGLQYRNKSFQIKIDHENHSSRSSLAQMLPLQLIHPKSFLLLDAGSQLRREFIDWGVFNMHEDFLLNWRKYNKALLQRNALLKQQNLKQIKIWNQELLRYGTIVDQYREKYLLLLQSYFIQVSRLFFDEDQLQLDYYQGWQDKHSFMQCLEVGLEKDLRYGYTQVGPHRADFKLRIKNILARDYVSRGQLKLLVLALKLAQVKMLEITCGTRACVLIDDFTAELDEVNKAILLDFLSELGVQVFMTATTLSGFGAIAGFKDYKLFHVEHGCISQM